MDENVYKGIDKFDQAEEYWLHHLAGQLNDIRLIGDFSTTHHYSPANFNLLLENRLTEKMIYLSKNNDLSLYILLLAVLKILIFKYTGHRDIIISSPVHKNINRKYNQYVALRDVLHPQLTFKDLLMKVKQTVVEGYKNGHYPLKHLKELLRIPDPSSFLRNVLALESIHEKEILQDIINDFKSDMIISFRKNSAEIAGQITYNEKRFTQKTIQCFFDCYRTILNRVLNNTSIKISAIELISEEEKHEILFGFNNTGKDIPIDKTIHELFEEQAEKSPGNLAVGSTLEMINIYDEEKPEKIDICLTYKELNHKANQLARVLRTKGITRNCLVGIMISHPLEIAASLLAILKAGGGYLPIDPDYSHQMKTYALKESNLQLLLVQTSLLDSVADLVPALAIISIEDNVNIISQQEEENLEPINDTTDLAYAIFTSGTTGKLKGVLIEHKGIVNYTRWRLESYHYTEKDVTLQLLSYCFDGFGSNFYSALLSGGTLIMVPQEKKLELDYIKESINHFGVTNMSLVPGLYEAILDHAGKNDLKSLRFIVLAGEKSSINVIKKTRKKLPGLFMFNEYGPTETTVTAAGHMHLDESNTAVIGQPIPNTRIYILDASQNPVPINALGEIYITGVGCARGYLNNPQLTREMFMDNPFNKGKNIDRIYRSGDLGRWLPNGTIEFSRRIDLQVKIRGYRIELEHIESQLLKHEKIKAAVVTAREDENGLNYLCAYIVSPEEIDGFELREYLLKELPDYMIPSYVVPVDKIPLTTNGKIDRNGLPEPEAAGAADQYAAPGNEIEEKLVAIWADVLDKDQDIIGIDANFFKLGGHSLKVTILAAKIHKELDRTIPLAEIFKIPTIRELAKYIKGCEEKEFASVEACEKKEHYVLSSAQKRLYIIQQLEINSIAYNMPQLYALGEKTEKQRLEKTLDQLIRRHENLRTSFKMVAGEPVQIIHEPQQIEFRVTYLESGEKDVGTLFKNFIKPFNLGNAPLLRVSLAIIQEKKHLMMIDMHHIITDGVSHEILIQDFNSLYASKELAPLALQYKDYSEWQYCDRQKTRIKQQEAYWLKEFSGEIPVMDLPTDFVRPEIQGFQGGIVDLEINKELTRKIKVLVRETEITLNIFLLAVYNILLSKYSGAEDIIVGIPVAGRTHDDLQRIIGMFVNMLPMRNRPSRDKTFITFLKEIKQNSLQAYENQDYQFDDLVLKLGLQGNRSRNPLFDVVFALQNVAETITSIHNKNNAKNNDDHLNTTPFQLGIQKFDLVLEAIEVHDFIHMSLGYSSDLFKRANVERMAKHYIDIMNQVLESIHIKLAEITIEHEFLVAQLNTIKEGEGDFRF